MTTEHQYDPELVQHGDTRNVVDKYRNWTVDAIKDDLDTTRIDLEIAVENLTRDFNMGTIVRTANAFNVRTVHIIGSRQWNKRGAMKTDAYMNLQYHASVGEFKKSAADKRIIAIDIVEGAKELSKTTLSKNAILVFGAEGPGLSKKLLDIADTVVMIEQLGSTRSVNVGVAAGIAMYAWLKQHVLTP